MTRTQFNSLRDSAYAEITAINDTKGKDYSGNDDALSNFHRLAERLGLSAEQVLMVYLQKHLDAITTYCKAGQVESEPIEGRINDAILYLFLLRGLVEERNQAFLEIRAEAVQKIAAEFNVPPLVPMGKRRGRPRKEASEAPVP